VSSACDCSPPSPLFSGSPRGSLARTSGGRRSSCGRVRREGAAGPLTCVAGVCSAKLANAEPPAPPLHPNRQARSLLEKQTRESALTLAALHTVSEDARGRVEENVELRFLCQRLGASEAELERTRRTIDSGAAAHSHRLLSAAVSEWREHGSAAPVSSTAISIPTDHLASPTRRALSMPRAPRLPDAAYISGTTQARLVTELGPSKTASPAQRVARDGGSPVRAEFGGRESIELPHTSLQEKLRIIRSKFADARESLERHYTLPREHG
jgi:hypothetical protein